MDDPPNDRNDGEPPSEAEPNGSNQSEDDLAWKTERRENAYACPGFSIVHEEVRLPDGSMTDFDYLHDGPSVVVLPFTPDGRLVVIDEWRQAVKRVTRSFPAGGIEPGEGIREAAKRELEEETGYEAADVTPLGTYEPATGFSDAVFHYFVATGCEPTGSQDLDQNESITVDTTTLPDLLEALLADELEDGRTALGLLRYVIERMDSVPVAPPES